MPAIPILKSLLGRRIGFSTRTPSVASNLIIEGGLVTGNLSGNPVTTLPSDLASIQGGSVKFPTSQPATPVAGSAWFDAVGHILHIYDGAVWRSSTLT